MIQVGILGAAGLSGQELLQRLAGHPEAEVRVATSTKFQHQGIHEAFPFLPKSSLTFRNVPEGADVPIDTLPGGEDPFILKVGDPIPELENQPFAVSGGPVMDAEIV